MQIPAAAKNLEPARPDPETTASIAPRPAPQAPEKQSTGTKAAGTQAPAAQAPAVKASPAPVTEVAKADADDASSFRWPVRGKIISGYGTRGTGGANDGINISVPEGTQIRASEAGTVVHADDVLKGYGKLVLIRHANGYVTVYAHNSTLQVKRGENVKRGQVIALSGQTGNVTSPQLHFELRKGATPIDPMPYLDQP